MSTALHLEPATRAGLDRLIRVRPGETRLGSLVQTAATPEEMAASTALFVLTGIPEDIGVRANYGVGGAHSAWEPALEALLNIQSTSRLTGAELLVWGAFDFSEWMQASETADATMLRELTGRMDTFIYPVIEQIIAAGKIPVIIGGGHNNAYPLIKGAARAKGRAISAINLDAHSDYRPAEGRHSGNGFRYAKEEGLLKKYAIVGLHENYNSQAVIDDMAQDPDIQYAFFEDLFLRGQQAFREAVTAAICHTAGQPCGIELDMDAITGVLSSAMTPSGITPLQARQYLTWCAAHTDAAYLHIAEGAATLRDGRTDATTGKLIAYLVSDFMKATIEKQRTARTGTPV